jgi:hypothetical protein
MNDFPKVNEFLFGNIWTAESIDFRTYFEKYCLNMNVGQSVNSNLIGLLKSLFKSLGFKFFIEKQLANNKSGGGEVLKLKLPDKSMAKKLELIQRCMLTLNGLFLYSNVYFF